jgi:hypothetical protein
MSKVPTPPYSSRFLSNIWGDPKQRGCNAMAIYQDLVIERGSYQSVKRFVNKLQPRMPQARAVIVTEPGEEATGGLRAI